MDNVYGTHDDNLRLLPGSPCIDFGDNVPVLTEASDLDNLPRFVDDPETLDEGEGDPPIVDLGVYEYRLPVGTVHFSDSRLKTAIEDSLGIMDPNFVDILALTHLNADSEGIVSLNGLEYARNLTFKFRNIFFTHFNH